MIVFIIMARYLDNSSDRYSLLETKNSRDDWTETFIEAIYY